MEIDKDKLKALASEADNSTEDIATGLGLGRAHNLHYHLKKDPELQKIFEDGRSSCGKLRAKPGTKQSAKSPRKSNRQSEMGNRQSSAAPPASKAPKQTTRNYSTSCGSNLITSMFTAKSVSTSMN